MAKALRGQFFFLCSIIRQDVTAKNQNERRHTTKLKAYYIHDIFVAIRYRIVPSSSILPKYLKVKILLSLCIDLELFFFGSKKEKRKFGV
jgi:hypothetical protein